MNRVGAKNNTETRPISIEQGILERSDGSCKFSLGSTVVLASVNGPMEVKHKSELADRATIEVIFKPLVGLSTCKDRVYESFVKDVVERVVATSLHPRSLIKIVLQVIEDDGSILPAAVNACLVGLMDAGVPLVKRCAACSVTFDQQGSICIDSDLIEEEKCKSKHTLCFVPESKIPLSVESSGVFTIDEFNEAISQASKATSMISNLIEKSTILKLKKIYPNVEE